MTNSSLSDNEIFKIAEESAKHLGKKISWDKDRDEIILTDKDNKMSIVKFEVLRKI